MHYGVHCRPHCVGRNVGRASAACGRFGEWSQRSLRCVGRMRYGSETLEILEIPLQYDFYNELWCIRRTRPTHSSSLLERQIEHRPQCVGRSASVAMRQTRVGRTAADYVLPLTSTTHEFLRMFVFSILLIGIFVSIIDLIYILKLRN